LQIGNIQMAFEEIANRNHAHLRPHPSGWQTSTVQLIIAAAWLHNRLFTDSFAGRAHSGGDGTVWKRPSIVPAGRLFSNVNMDRPSCRKC
jgi:hypothetical protein